VSDLDKMMTLNVSAIFSEWTSMTLKPENTMYYSSFAIRRVCYEVEEELHNILEIYSSGEGAKFVSLKSIEDLLKDPRRLGIYLTSENKSLREFGELVARLKNGNLE
jgi:hypothetical protein